MLITTEFIVVWSLLLRLAASFRPPWRYYQFYYPAPMERLELDPIRYTTPLPPNVNGSMVTIPAYYETPDYRMEEQPYFRYYHYHYFEEERPYRLSPFYKQVYYWNKYESPYMLGCTCTTAFKKLTPLATCSVLTRRHVLTTATSTELVLRRRRHFLHLEDILGVWYDIWDDRYNSSMYATVARITYHPRYLRPELVNRSHPFPMTFDLAIYTMTHRLYTGWWGGGYIPCQRAGSGSLVSLNPTPYPNELVIVVAFQFIKAFRRPPSPFVKYGVRTRRHLQPCPKTEWGWFHCVPTIWAKYGLDQGANLHRTAEGAGWLGAYDGLFGMNTLSLKLRSTDMVNYFINLDSHEVLDFLYNAYMGLLPYEYLDYRFLNVPYETLITKDEEKDGLWWNWDYGEEYLYYADMPNY